MGKIIRVKVKGIPNELVFWWQRYIVIYLYVTSGTYLQLFKKTLFPDGATCVDWHIRCHACLVTHAYYFSRFPTIFLGICNDCSGILC